MYTKHIENTPLQPLYICFVYMYIVYMCFVYMYKPYSPSTHGGDQTWNIFISRSIDFPNRSFEWRGLRLLNWKSVWNLGHSREYVFDLYGIPWKLVEYVGSRNFVKYDLLRLLVCMVCIQVLYTCRGPFEWCNVILYDAATHCNTLQQTVYMFCIHVGAP